MKAYIYTDSIFKTEMVKAQIAGETYRFTTEEVRAAAAAIGVRGGAASVISDYRVQYELLRTVRRKGGRK